MNITTDQLRALIADNLKDNNHKVQILEQFDLMKETVWKDACKKILSDISETFLNKNNINKADKESDKDVFIAIGQTIKKFPIPDPNY